MTVECPSCNTSFPVDPNKVPAGGVHARCSVCDEVFFVEEPILEAEPIPVQDLPETPAEEVDLPSEEAEAEVLAEEEAFEAPPAEEEEVAPAFEAPVDDTPAFEAPVDDAPAPSFGEAEPTFGEGETTFDMGAPAVDTPIEESPAFDAPVEEVPTFQEEAPAPPDPTPMPLPTPQFGKRDPKEKAKRLARVLVSDIILYNPDRHQRALDEGRIKEEFDDEIQKSWNEYVDQVGEEVANSTNFFNEALNEILAKGQQVF